MLWTAPPDRIDKPSVSLIILVYLAVSKNNAWAGLPRA
jgi:hypothetical protein